MIEKETNTATGMVKEITTGLALIGGVVAIVVGAEIAAPAVAGIGAAVSLGAGLAEALSAPKRPSSRRRGQTANCSHHP